MFQFPQLQHLRDGHSPRLPMPHSSSPMPQPQIPTLLNPCQPIARHPNSFAGTGHPIWGIQQTSSSHFGNAQVSLSTSVEQQMPHEVYVHATPKMHSKPLGLEEHVDCTNQKIVSQSNQINPIMNVNLGQGAPVNIFWNKRASDVHKHPVCGIDEQNEKLDNRMMIEQNISRMVDRFTSVKQETCNQTGTSTMITSSPSTLSGGVEDTEKHTYSKAATDLLVNVGSETVLSSNSLDPTSQCNRDLLSNKNNRVPENTKIDSSRPHVSTQLTESFVGEEKDLNLAKNEHATPKERWHCPYENSMSKTHADQLSLKRTGKDPSESTSEKQCNTTNVNNVKWTSPAEDSNLTVKQKRKNAALAGKEAAGCQIKNFCCKTCGKTFAKSEKLRIHQQIHSDEKLYECTDCEWAFRRREHLIRHMMTHTGELPYECKTCGHKFRRNEHLKRHQLVHTGETPYQCTRCDKQFKRSERLRRHMSTHFTALVSPK